MRKIIKITENKKKYLNLLLLGDEQEDMLDRYLERGDMLVLCDGDARAVCVVTDEGERVLEIKNIAVSPEYRGRGCGRALVEYLEQQYKNDFDYLLAGTGDSPLTVPFYEKCGFVRSHTVENFFTDNYDHPIFECGVQLRDMIYFKKQI